jgi:hypothetical protein
MKRVAFIFPGQGSQTIGMGKDFFENSDIAKDMISKASDRLGIDFEKLLFEENENIGKTEFTQPAILLVSSIANAIFKEKCNITPEFVLGHSLGEFSALVAAGAMDYLDAIELVHKRGLFMTEACSGGGAGMMALVGEHGGPVHGEPLGDLGLLGDVIELLHLGVDVGAQIERRFGAHGVALGIVGREHLGDAHFGVFFAGISVGFRHSNVLLYMMGCIVYLFGTQQSPQVLPWGLKFYVKLPIFLSS